MTAALGLRPQCAKCPWRDMDDMRTNWPAQVERAQASPFGFVCHVRCGPCDGPRHSGTYQSMTPDDLNSGVGRAGIEPATKAL